MTQLEALKDLLAKVEAGDVFLDGSPSNVWRKDVAELADAALGADNFDSFAGAFEGSLDAAQALHEGVLPGWGWAVGVDFYTGTVRSTARVSHLGTHFGHIIEHEHLGFASRTLLAADLKALIAQEGAK